MKGSRAKFVRPFFSVTTTCEAWLEGESVSKTSSDAPGHPRGRQPTGRGCLLPLDAPNLEISTTPQNVSKSWLIQSTEGSWPLVVLPVLKDWLQQLMGLLKDASYLYLTEGKHLCRERQRAMLLQAAHSLLIQSPEHKSLPGKGH